MIAAWTNMLSPRIALCWAAIARSAKGRSSAGDARSINSSASAGLAIIAGNEAASQDIPPFASMRYGGLKAYNARGCQRAELSHAAIRAIRRAYHCLHNHRIVSAALDEIRETVPDLPEIRELIEFITSSKRGIVPSVTAHETPLRVAISGMDSHHDHSAAPHVRYAGAYEQYS